MFRFKESQVQLGPGDGGLDPRLFFLGLHRDANPGRLHLLQAGGEQVGGSTVDTKQLFQPLNPLLLASLGFDLIVYFIWGLGGGAASFAKNKK